MTPKRLWFVRAGRDAAFVDQFRSGNHVALGWAEVGRVDPDIPDDVLDERFAQAFPKAKDGTRAVWAAQVKRFLRELEVGDGVVTYDPNERHYLLGTITSKVEHVDGVLPRLRRVKWTHRVPRDVLSVSTRNGLGSIATLFRPSAEASAELWANAVGIDEPLTAQPVEKPPAAAASDDEDEADLLREQFEKADRFIEDRIAELDWVQMQELVAGVLRSMGYRTRVSPRGSDRGVDVFASPDGLGLQEPRIFCEVKHRSNEIIGAPELRAFLGGRQRGDRCLYVSTGGFTKEARYEADRSPVPLRLLTLSDFRQLLVDQYESLDAETRALVPLKRLYWPVD
jgi:restriction system protein